MRPSQARFVTACQQLLALGVVLAVLTPAAGIISIDVVGEAPGAAPRDPAGGATFAAYTREAARPSVLPGEAVKAKVHEYPLTAPSGTRISARGLAARTLAGPGDTTQVTSSPEPVVSSPTHWHESSFPGESPAGTFGNRKPLLRSNHSR